MARAISITEHIESLQNELRAWNENTREGVVSPLSFRIGHTIKYMYIDAFEQFKAIHMSRMAEKIAELEAEFAGL